LNQSELLKLLAEAGALVTQSHIVYTSGKHGDSYVNKDAIYPHTSLTAKLCEKIAENFLSEAIDVVVSPAVGAIILSQWTSHFLSALSPKEVLAVYAEKDGAGFVIKRGYEKLLPQRRVLVVEDVLTTGGSVKKVVEVCRTLGGTVDSTCPLTKVSARAVNF
jgi:orotate phosphoribosyltransferase